MTPRETLVAVYRAAIAAVNGAAAVERALRSELVSDTEECWSVLAAGKAARSMVEGALAALGSRVVDGIATTRDEAEDSCGPVRVQRAGHPLPDARSLRAAEEALHFAASLPADRRLLVLISGGASALWAAPAAGVPLEEKRALTLALLNAGVPIEPLNLVRQHLSRIKGGGLLRAARVPVWTLAISDVAGDAPERIGSGPTVATVARYAEACRVVKDAGFEQLAPACWKHLSARASGEPADDPRDVTRESTRSSFRIVASLGRAIEAALAEASRRGLRARRLDFDLCGEARALAPRLVDAARKARGEGVDLLVTGGEPIVHVRGDGRGGRAQELALAFALEAERLTWLSALVAGTDGSDGPTDAAGAFVAAHSLSAARQQGIDPNAALERNDSYRVHRASGGLLITGATGTNVTDLALLLLREELPEHAAG